MFIYHPAFDLYNCIFRLLQLLSFMKEAEVEVDRLRIWDFYLTFPREVQKIQFPAELFKLKRIFKEKDENPYEDIVDSKKIIERMKPYQLTALKALASYGFISSSELARGVVKKEKLQLPEELNTIVSGRETERTNILKLITGFRDLPLFGSAGLKARTGLIQYKYDPR